MAGHGTAAHQRARARLLSQHDEGDPCARCGRPTYSWQDLDADHVTIPLVLGGGLPDALTHARCNRYSGWLVSRVRTGQSTPPKVGDPQLEDVRQQVLRQLAELGQDVVMPEPLKPIVTRTSRAW